jgi:hypothetical protein
MGKGGPLGRKLHSLKPSGLVRCWGLAYWYVEIHNTHHIDLVSSHGSRLRDSRICFLIFVWRSRKSLVFWRSFLVRSA